MAASADEVTRLNPTTRVILQGLYDVGSPWHRLLGIPHVVKTIWLIVFDHWKSKIKETGIEDAVLSVTKVQSRRFRESDKDYPVKFPEPSDININMMPFRRSYKFKETKLPEYLFSYWNRIIQKYHCHLQFEMGKIGYLTIQESFVYKKSSQRRPGIQTESPGVVIQRQNGKGSYGNLYWWIGGSYEIAIYGGIYMPSNVENSCRVWNCLIERPEDGCPDIVGDLGDIDLREFLPASSEVMASNKLNFLTDRTPHESLPLSEGTYRQFFRLVTSQVSVWYEDHSTKNPLGVVPDPTIPKVLKGSKFAGSCYQIDESASVQTSG